ncbi:HelD family protein [Clostridium thermarum]|uniref:HelD family protein n=1 Tax=Clostridium thermarum TaxID=1716543 RepID=UPI0013D0889C|nr:UvrD-helicase domain-containing protein [Clostridium thermarum]
MDNKDFHIDKEEVISESIKEAFERNLEEERLEYTKNVIKAEILKYISKRKEFGQYILEYRKNVLDEYREDEDKITEYFDHERFVKEEAFKTIDRRLKELVILENAPYFGRVDFTELDSEDEETVYIGRFGLTPEGTYEPLVVDWRAPIAALFYSGKLGKATYKAPVGEIEADVLLKRQFIIKRGQLTGMFDSAAEVKDDILQLVLSENSSQKLKDIVMTIQEEQDNIIRQPRTKTVVVNGVAGSGKTTIALHRVAYLLYNYRDILQDKVLILGPNSIFMEYISMVLPSLGEVGVKQRTFKDYAMELLNIEHIMPFKEYMEKVLAGDKELLEDIGLKNSPHFIEILDEKLMELDTDYFKAKDVYLEDILIISAKEIEELFTVHYHNLPLFRRTRKARRIIFSKIKDVRDDLIRKVQREYKQKIASMSPEQLNAQGSQLEFMRRSKIREILRASLNTKEALSWLDNPSVMEIYDKMNGGRELIYDDLAPLLYISLKLKGRLSKEDIRHVVIDEAQDYSILQFRVIKEITNCSSMTIVGDVNQRLLPYAEAVPMTELSSAYKEFGIEYFTLEKSYRSTREIMEYANRYLKDSKIVPLVRSGEEVKEVGYKEEEELKELIRECLEQYKNRGYENIAVIVRDLTQLNYLRALTKGEIPIRVVDDEDLIFAGGTVLMPSYYAKGLEFDAVVIVDVMQSNNSIDNNINYVMCSRALHELTVIKKS